MTAASWAGFAVGVAALVVTFATVMDTLIVPRATAPRLTVTVFRLVRGAFLLVTDRIRSYRARDRVAALNGPALLVVLLLVWVALIYLSFALMFWPFAGSFPRALVTTGSSMFTLGFVAPAGTGPTLLVFLCAMSGLVIVALQIAYLPTLYAAFNRRETLVTMLEFLGGAPAWGPEILVRHELIDNNERLGWLYERWTEWAADVSESHTTYPVLLYFRSPNPYRSWLGSLLAVMDAAALHQSLSPISAPASARPLLRMGYVALAELARSVHVQVNPDPDPADPIQLPRAEFDRAVELLAAVGWAAERDPEEAWRHFRGWRVNYEDAAYGLAYHLDTVPAPWSGPRRAGRDEVIRPARPAHRVPLGDEKARLLKVRDKRRASRRAAEHALRAHHDGEAYHAEGSRAVAGDGAATPGAGEAGAVVDRGDGGAPKGRRAVGADGSGAVATDEDGSVARAADGDASVARVAARTRKAAGGGGEDTVRGGIAGR